MRDKKNRIVYLIGPVDGCHKIGASRYPVSRLGQLNLPGDCAVVGTITVTRDHWLEKYLHLAFDHRRVSGEWFRLDDAEVALILSVPHARRVADLPEAVIALHAQNKKRQEEMRKASTAVVGREVKHAARLLAAFSGISRREVFDKYVLPVLKNELARVLREERAKLDTKKVEA